MSLELNKVILAGRLTADPELKVTTSGVNVTSFTIAIGRRVPKDAEKATDFINVVAWRSTAEFISKFFGKGKAILICGRIQTRSWTDMNGQKRYATEVVADEAYFVESKGSETGAPAAPAPYGEKPPVHFEEMTPDDDLPF